MNKTVKITLLSARKLEKIEELFATVGAIYSVTLNLLVHLKNGLKYYLKQPSRISAQGK